MQILFSSLMIIHLWSSVKNSMNPTVMHHSGRNEASSRPGDNDAKKSNMPGYMIITADTAKIHTMEFIDATSNR